MQTKSSYWSAWHNTSAGPSFNVAGIIDVGNVNDSYFLQKIGIEGPNPPSLILKLTSQTILVPRPAGEHIVLCHYKEDNVQSYRSIKILSEDAKEVVCIENLERVYKGSPTEQSRESNSVHMLSIPTGAPYLTSVIGKHFTADIYVTNAKEVAVDIIIYDDATTEQLAAERMNGRIRDAASPKKVQYYVITRHRSSSNQE